VDVGILNETRGVMLLHMVLDGAIADEDMQKEIRRLCRTYPNVRLILCPHIARSLIIEMHEAAYRP